MGLRTPTLLIKQSTQETFVQRCLLLIIQPFDDDNQPSTVVLEQCSNPLIKRSCKSVFAAGLIVMYLSPYFPDLMPIEKAFAKVEAYI